MKIKIIIEILNRNVKMNSIRIYYVNNLMRNILFKRYIIFIIVLTFNIFSL